MSNNKALAYIRTSSDDRQDASPDVQLDKIKSYCDKQGWDLVGHYEDYLSGGTELGKRPQFDQVDQPGQGRKDHEGRGPEN